MKYPVLRNHFTVNTKLISQPKLQSFEMIKAYFSQHTVIADFPRCHCLKDYFFGRSDWHIPKHTVPKCLFQSTFQWQFFFPTLPHEFVFFYLPLQRDTDTQRHWSQSGKR